MPFSWFISIFMVAFMMLVLMFIYNAIVNYLCFGFVIDNIKDFFFKW